MRKLILSIFIVTLALIFLFAVGIRMRAEKDSSFGKQLFDGRFPHEYFELAADFSLLEQKHQSSVLVLFNPECEVCYSEINSIIKKKYLFSKSNLVLATTADSLVTLDYITKFDFSGFNALKIGTLHSSVLERYIIPYPTVIVYDQEGNFLRGFKGSVEPENILK